MHIRSPPFQARGKQASTKQPDKWENAPMFRTLDFVLRTNTLHYIKAFAMTMGGWDQV